MDPNQQKEQFSAAHLRVIAATAGYAMAKPDPDDDSVDWTLARRGGGGTIRSPKVDVQLKCSSRESDDVTVRDDAVSFRLKRKNFDELRLDNYQVPRILLLVLVPAAVPDWLDCSEEALLLKASAYWCSLAGLPESPNRGDKVAVQLPRSQRFDVEAVHGLMDRIARGERR